MTIRGLSSSNKISQTIYMSTHTHIFSCIQTIYMSTHTHTNITIKHSYIHTQVDAHRGFDIVTDKIQTTDKRSLLVITSVLAFFMSAVLDNLTTTIVMVSLLSKLVTVCLFFF